MSAAWHVQLDAVIEFRINCKISLLHVGDSFETFEVPFQNPLVTNLNLTFNFPFAHFSELTHLNLMNS